MLIDFRDTDAAVVAALRDAFSGVAGATFEHGTIFDGTSADAIVSPANSFGDMGGGIDLAYLRHFPHGLEARLQDAIRADCFGELPVGQALVVATADAAIPWMICAPTMRVPAAIAGTLNVYVAFRAALVAALRHAAGIDSLLSPGMGTGVGAMPPQRAARQMRAAWDAIVAGHWQRSRNAGAIWGEHLDLLR